ncbi:hypothetical protein Acr_01g0006220 [Actinidia rufa]|uniref:Uncharacterized protein n=1 Tax=Actinidia rufa TaxID=165716 RepID=A0A7J0E2Q8_9ERIC|nr:hypothetical protein Acr_01g0006220 [Actinidia rufa]
MEVGSFSSDVVAMEELMVCSIVEDVVVETLLAAHRSLACLLMVGYFEELGLRFFLLCSCF